METSAPDPQHSRSAQAQCADADLVVRALLGNLRAFDELARRWRPAVIATASLVARDRAAAEDLAQEVFLAAFFALPQLDDPARFGGWVRTIARRQAGRHRHRERGRRAELPLLEDLVGLPLASHAADPQATLAQQEDRELLWAALQTLPPGQREILLLHTYEDWSLARIADYLSIEEGTARVRLFRARQALRRVWSALHGEG